MKIRRKTPPPCSPAKEAEESTGRHNPLSLDIQTTVTNKKKSKEKS